MTYSRRIENPLDFGKVGVVMGGATAERDISLNSGKAVLSALLARDVNSIGIDISAHPLKIIQSHRLDRVFNIVHGRGGEDGVLQGLLDAMGIPYTGSGVLGSALTMDKVRTKRCWHGSEIPTPHWHVLRQNNDLVSCREHLGFPVIVKPAREGSSFGISKAKDETELEQAWKNALQYKCEVFAESWIEGQEYTVGFLGEQALPLVRLETPREFYDYEAKYVADSTQYICPAGLAGDLEEEFQKIAMAAASTLDVSGWGRVDFIVDKELNPWFIEVNTVPGMTNHSLVPMAAKAIGVDFEELVWRVLETSVNEEG